MKKEDVKKVLEALQQFAAWMYYSPDAVNMFKAQKFPFEEKVLSIDINANGDYVLVADDQSTGVYKVGCITSPIEIEGTMDNLGYQLELLNKEELDAEQLEYFKRAGVFVLSAFQRSNAFQFFCRMAPETIANLANSLPVEDEQSKEEESKLWTPGQSK